MVLEPYAPLVPARDEQHDPHQLVGSSALDDKLERPAPHRVVSEANYPRVKR